MPEGIYVSVDGWCLRQMGDVFVLVTITAAAANCCAAVYGMPSVYRQ